MNGRQRPGFSMTELIVAMVVMGGLLTMIGQSTILVSQQQRAVQQQQFALNEVSNIMERAFALPFEQLTSEAIDAWPLSPDCRQRLAGAVLEGEIVESNTDGLTARRIRLALRWQSRTGGDSRQVQLTSWRYAADQEQDE
jgi:prepilin-type N-terminal cleavage/methylation domain-containing protein